MLKTLSRACLFILLWIGKIVAAFLIATFLYLFIPFAVDYMRNPAIVQNYYTMMILEPHDTSGVIRAYDGEHYIDFLPEQSDDTKPGDWVSIITDGSNRVLSVRKITGEGAVE